MDVGAFRSAQQVLEFAAFEGGGAARVLGKALTRLERAAEAGALPASSALLHQVETSLIGSQAVLSRAVADGVGHGVTTELLGDAHRTAGNVLAIIRGVKAPPTHEAQLLGRTAQTFDAAGALRYLAG